jgi:hypothetical protein
MPGMDAFEPFRKHLRLSLCLLAIIYLCFVLRVVKDPLATVMLVGVGILVLIFFYPSKPNSKLKRRKLRPPPPLKKTKKYLDFN